MIIKNNEGNTPFTTGTASKSVYILHKDLRHHKLVYLLLQMKHGQCDLLTIKILEFLKMELGA